MKSSFCCKSLQEPGELRPRVVKLLGGGFGLRFQLLPLVDQKLPLFRFESRILRQLPKLVVDVIERLGAKLRNRTVVGDGA